MAKVIVSGSEQKIEGMKKLLRSYGVTFLDVPDENPVPRKKPGPKPKVKA